MSTSIRKEEIVNLAIEIVLKVVLLGIILYWAFLILKPFILLVIWAVIIAVTLSPMVTKLEQHFNGRRKTIIWTIALFGMLAIFLPSYMLSDSIVSSSQHIAQELREGTFHIPPPPDKVAQWPIVGHKVHALWSDGATNLGQTLQHYQSELKEYGGKIAVILGSAFATVFEFIVALLIAAIFLTNSEGSVKIYNTIARRLLGEKGVEWAQLSALTVRSVVQGILGIAIIQASLALIGMLIIDVPLAPLWGFLVLFLAIIQLPTIIILGPIMAYVFSYADGTSATIFAVWSILVGLSDNFLKPLLLGRGVDIPMLVILLGAIGGMLLSGVIGLFIGAVVLALAYKLFVTWMDAEVQEQVEKER